MVVSFVNRIQTRNRLIQLKIRQMRRRLEELEEICAGIEPLLESVLIPKLINEEILNLISSIGQLDPTATFIEVKRENALDLAEKLGAEQRTLPLYRALPSDASIARHKYYLTEAARIVRRHQAIGRLQPAEMDDYISELAWALLAISVISHMVQGHKAVNRNEPMVAYGYYRKAQNFLMSANTSDGRRHRLIREISEILSGKRLALSTDLMPETEFNPTQKPNFEGAVDVDDLNKLGLKFDSQKPI